MRKAVLLLFVLLFALVVYRWQRPRPQTELESGYSRLWGKNGEAWSPAGRMTDYSFAGYRMGQAIPEIEDPEQVDVKKDFQAVGDGAADDTESFVRALNKKKSGVIFIPPGRYKITSPLLITRSGIILRGADPKNTTLYFPEPLMKTIRPEHVLKGQDAPSWATRVGYLWVQGINWPFNVGGKLADVVRPAARGDNTLEVSDASGMKAGDTVIFSEEDNGDNSLWYRLHGDERVCCAPTAVTATWFKAKHTFFSKVESVHENQVTLVNPLVLETKTVWKPALYAYKGGIEDVGVENLSIEFSSATYVGHHLEIGNNAIFFGWDTSNCWVRNVSVRNSEVAVGVSGGRFITLESLEFSADPQVATTNNHDILTFPKTGFHTGHIGVELIGSQGVLVRNVTFDTTFVHDLSIRALAHGNVFSNIRGIDIDFDHHRTAPHDNLYSNIDLGEGTRLWSSGGPVNAGPHSGGLNTYWNIRARRSLSSAPKKSEFSEDNWGPEKLNFVAFSTSERSVLDPSSRWFEKIPPNKLSPQDLYEAQVALRLSKERAGQPTTSASVSNSRK